MRFSMKISKVVIIGAALAALMFASIALAQQPFPQPFGPPMGAPAPGTTMGMPYPGPPVGMEPCGPFIGTGCQTRGSIYIEGGVKYRNIYTLEMQRVPHRVAGADPGTVPFGPSGDAVHDPGPLALRYPPFPVSVAANPDPNFNGLWIYDDGRINPRYATNWNEDVLPDSSLGHVGGNGNVGRFIVRNPSAQADNGLGPYYETSSVTWHLALEDSLVVAAAVNDSKTVGFAEQFWAPYIELGYRPSSFFDLFFAISWFTTTKSDRNTHRVDEPVVGRNRINDTFPFFSNRDASWPNAVVRSSDFVVADFLIFPVGGPVRSFDVTPLIAADQVLDMSETLSNRIDLTMVEFKGGLRNWFSVLNWGAFGFETGPLLAVIPYKVEASQSIRTLDDILNPNDGILYPSGTVLLTDAHEHGDTLWDLGWYAAVDMAVRYGSVYGKGSVGYDVYFRNLKYTSLGAVETRFNPSGLALTVTGGVNF